MGAHRAPAVLAEPLTERPRTTAVPDGDAGWERIVERADDAYAPRRPTSVRRVLVRFAAANLAALTVLLLGSTWASREAARSAALDGATHRADLLAELLVEPVLTDAVVNGDRGAQAALDSDLRGRLSAAGISRVKLWTAEGRIAYSDDPRLIDKVYPLSAEDLEALADGRPRADVSDMTRSENELEQQAGTQLEVYRRVTTLSGRPMLFETYEPYAQTAARQREIFSRFLPVVLTVLVVLWALQVPLVLRMLRQLQAVQRERELLQQRAADASADERRRIAGSLHDGIVQDVSAASLLVARAADRVRGRPAGPEVAAVLGDASSALRGSVSSLRSLLLEIYPPHLARAGLPSALADLAARLRPRGVEVHTSWPEDLEVPLEQATLVFRTAHEVLANVDKHAGARTVDLRLTRPSPRLLVLEVTDDGVGFDLAAALDSPRAGHLGLSVLADLARTGGASLDMRSAPGAGTAVRLEVPLP
jgi:signal transduction histidine kinase